MISAYLDGIIIFGSLIIIAMVCNWLGTKLRPRLPKETPVNPNDLVGDPGGGDYSDPLEHING